MSLDPEQWGPYVWGTLHLVALGAPETIELADKPYYRNFINLFANVIPCEKCKKHLGQHLEKHPVDPALTGRDALFEWSVNLHNIVNKMLGKSEMSLDDALHHWRNVNKNGIDASLDKKYKKINGFMLFIAIVFSFAAGFVICKIMFGKSSKSK